MRIYFAGPLFTQAERAWNRQVAEVLEAAGHQVFLPQNAMQGHEPADAESIFRKDVEGVATSEALVAVLDGADADSGTCFECGLAYALGIPILAVRTDFRAGGDALPGQALMSINLMLSQAAAQIVNVTDPNFGPEAVAGALVRALAHPPQAPKPPRRHGPNGVH
ncbi:MAG: nucleoside 2-deoxyribosyltransferase [Isosphaeraceae bacterium]